MPPAEPEWLRDLDRLPAPPRLCRRPLPPYRFFPGLAPHPVADPAGYRHGHPAERALALPDAQWRQAAAYLFGCDLYNRGYWWEAHEAWEGLWQATRDRPQQHRFLQGLIQAANAQMKLALQKPQAVCRLWAKAEAHFDEATEAPCFMGLALADWRRATARYLDARLAERPLRHRPEGFPMIDLHNFAL